MKRKYTITSNDSHNNNNHKPKSNVSSNRGYSNQPNTQAKVVKEVKEEKGIILLNKQVCGLKNAAAARKQKRKRSTQK